MTSEMCRFYEEIYPSTLLRASRALPTPLVPKGLLKIASLDKQHGQSQPRVSRRFLYSVQQHLILTKSRNLGFNSLDGSTRNRLESKADAATRMHR